MRIGELLLQSGLVTADQLAAGLDHQNKNCHTQPIGQVLCVLDFLTEEDLQLVLEAQRRIRLTAVQEELAVASLRIAKQKKISFDLAMTSVLEAIRTASFVTAEPASAVEATPPSLPAYKEPEPQKQAPVLLTLAQLVMAGSKAIENNQLEEAIQVYREISDLYEKSPETGTEELLQVLSTLANLYSASKNFKDAEHTYLRLLDLLRRLHGDRHPDVAATLVRMADMYVVRGKPENAEPLYNEALSIWMDTINKDRDKFMNALRKAVLAKTHHSQWTKRKKVGELLAEAGLLKPEQFQEALHTSKRERKPFGKVLIESKLIHESDLRAALKIQIMIRAGALPAEYGAKLIRASALLRQSIDDLLTPEDLLPPKHTVEGRDLIQLIMYMDKLLHLEGTLGLDHPDIADLGMKIGDISYKRREFDECDTMFARARQIYATAGEDYKLRLANACARHAKVHIERNRFAEAEPLLMEAMEIRQKFLGNNHPEVTNALIDVAEMHYRQQNYIAALGFYRTALMMKEAQLGPNNPELRPILENLSTCCRETGQDEMESQFKERASAL